MKSSLALLLFPCLLSAEITTSSISSKKASYDKEALVLKGEVQVEHSLGKMQSGLARLEKKDANGPFSIIHLNNNVEITLQNLGKILCDRADFDFNALVGKLFSKASEKIYFSNITSGPALFLSTRGAIIKFAKEASGGVKIAKIQAEDDVHIHYGKEITLTADHALYCNGKTPYIRAYSNCLLTHLDDRIDAREIDLSLTNSQILFLSPKGILKSSVFFENQKINFSCNQLIWQRAENLLTLTGDVSIHDETLWEIFCDN